MIYENIKIILPEDVKFILNKLNKSGYGAYAVGGCVRDSLLGITPNDWDICTSATPVQTKQVFKDFLIFDAGAKHGTISVVYNDNVYEITTFRVDGEYLDCRHPQRVSFTDDITQDLLRRDFTVNAMAYNEQRGLVDPFGGMKDLESHLISCVGAADERFGEDALRVLRALRFAAVYSFDIEEKTAEAIHKNAYLLKNIAAERIAAELNKLLCSKSVCKICEAYRDVIAVFIPEISCEFDYNQQNPHHKYDLWRHTLLSVSSAPYDLVTRMALLLHDVGKPYCRAVDSNQIAHYFGHAGKSAEIADGVFRRLKYPNEFISRCIALIKHHEFNYSGSKIQLKRLLNSIGENDLRLLFKMRFADIMAQSEYLREEKLKSLAQAKDDLDEIIAQNQCFSLKQLAVNGNDLKSIGIKEGREIGKMLKTLLELVIKEKLPNDKDKLMAKAKEIIY